MAVAAATLAAEMEKIKLDTRRKCTSRDNPRQGIAFHPARFRVEAINRVVSRVSR
jgi:hypothetical protein